MRNSRHRTKHAGGSRSHQGLDSTVHSYLRTPETYGDACGTCNLHHWTLSGK
jgi:hypothetical protein